MCIFFRLAGNWQRWWATYLLATICQNRLKRVSSKVYSVVVREVSIERSCVSIDKFLKSLNRKKTSWKLEDDSMWAWSAYINILIRVLVGESSGRASRAVAKHIPGPNDPLRERVSSATGEVNMAHQMVLERGEKLSHLEERTARMMSEAENFSQGAHGLMLKYKDKKWYQLWERNLVRVRWNDARYFSYLAFMFRLWVLSY